MAGFVVAAIMLLVTSHSGFVGDYNSYAQPFTHHAEYVLVFHGAGEGGRDRYARANELA